MKRKQDKILLEYLPQQLKKLEILETFRETVVKLGANSMENLRKIMFAELP
ncbi:GatB/YqeY domain-containing protein [Clostridium sp. FP2]|uniref:GatB/YqeY domain-containing protein n=1 Tax=Clostridium TaxID=1485 RepID=UPI000F625D6B|nr:MULTISPECIES: GatB/YqeY domain-containing protein [Clostridium]MBU3128456.1 GatB/YqeY domain-containing protein [Clostridium tagluense]MBW9155038.1 GatB/YqeY domain-containing protein [Clostridium tagluense]MBZ9624650.1 GatB/YqeY domain-containing protein [Clostridium sp. FP2]MCB2297264.1 GatB/YqeY domain-containing protein [Clostridium tagluense]WLC64486.1 GatB/YqeY domain-containing protein [Clostridium tagluense]